MKKIIVLLSALIAISLSSCIIVSDGYGPNGRTGRAYFGISYDYNQPYSYWDNNAAIPENPYFDEYYPTGTGIYDFEYFVNRVDYWYGTYEIWVNPGEPGRPNNIRGRDGFDTYLMLICNPNGPIEYRKSADTSLKSEILADGSLQYTIENEGGGMKVNMKKVNIKERPAKKAKWISAQ